MSFQFSDQHIEEYHTWGYTLFRSILPPSLIADLRRVTDRAREIAREKHGPQAQRLQPVFAYDLDPKPFVAFGELPPLRDAIARVLSPRHTFATRSLLGVLIEPAQRPWCTKWHRDWRDNMPGLDVPAWEAVSARNTLWHLGSYVPYGKRATLHDVVDTQAFIEWRKRVRGS